jgi:hypothetical protein
MNSMRMSVSRRLQEHWFVSRSLSKTRRYSATNLLVLSTKWHRIAASTQMVLIPATKWLNCLEFGGIGDYHLREAISQKDSIDRFLATMWNSYLSVAESLQNQTVWHTTTETTKLSKEVVLSGTHASDTDERFESGRAENMLLEPPLRRSADDPSIRLLMYVYMPGQWNRNLPGAMYSRERKWPPIG